MFHVPLTVFKMDNAKLFDIVCYGNESFHAKANYLSRLINWDESWVNHYDPAMKQETSVWKYTQSPLPKKVLQVKSVGKIMFIVFFDSKWILYQPSVQPNMTINATYYISVLKKLRWQMIAKCRVITGNWVLCHDNTRSYFAKLTKEFLEQHGITTMPQFSYSPDLTPRDFWLFLRLFNCSSYCILIYVTAMSINF